MAYFIVTELRLGRRTDGVFNEFELDSFDSGR